MTPKQIVRNKYPKAYAYKWGGASPWVIYAAKDGTWQGLSLNVSDTSEAKAWQQAAQHYTITGIRT